MKTVLAPDVSFTLGLVLTEPEARALADIASYDVEPMINLLRQFMGERALGEIEPGLRSLLISARSEIPAQLSRVDAARRAFVQ